MSTDQTGGTTPFEYGFTPVDVEQSSTSSPVVGEQSQGSGAPTTTLPGPQTEAIEFRVVRPGVPVRRLRLTGNRYTFGSADGCSIRLNDPTLRPMHAVLIRDANRVLVRAYSVPLDVNDNRVTETCLQLGDVMRMGAYRFELLSGIDPATPHAGAPGNVMNTPNGPMTPRELLGDASEATRFVEGIDAHQQAIQARIQRESAQWRSRQGEVDLRETRCIERESDLRAREAELWSRSEQVHRRESQLMSQEAAVLQIQEEFAARQREVGRLRDENRVHRELLDERQSQIGELESEYRKQVEDASRQLELSQQQAESATHAVARMREQFTKLNDQLAHLVSQQSQIESQDEDHLEQHRRLRLDLETARDEAIDARAESEAKRRDAEEQVEQLTARLAEFESGTVASDQQISEAESINQQLREQIEDLQRSVSEATDEAHQLRQDYEGSCASVRQLELLVDQTSAERDDARNTLVAESDALRQSVEQLTFDLGQANEELAKLREANESLTQELESTQEQRDEAVSDAESRPSMQAFEDLQRELEETSARLDQMQSEYSATLDREDEFADNLANESDDTESSGGIASALAAGAVGFAASAMLGTDTADDADTTEEASSEAASEVVGAESIEDDTESPVDEDESAWPTYDSTPAEPTTEDSFEPEGHASQQEESSEQDEASQWRREGEQSVEGSDHLPPADDSYGEQIDPDRNSFGVDPYGTNPYDASVHGESPAAQVDANATDDPVWKDETPEVSVNEAIADIEQNVDQALAEIDSIGSDIVEDDFSSADAFASDLGTSELGTSELGTSELGTSELESSELETSDSETSELETGETEVSEFQASDAEASYSETTEPESSDSAVSEFEGNGFVASEFDSSESAEEEPSGYQPINPWASESEVAETPEPVQDSESSFYSDPDEGDDVAAATPTEQISEYASERIGEIADLGTDETTEDGSLADMLIRDLGDDEVADSHADQVDEAGDESSSTYVMDDFTPAGQQEEQPSAWDMQAPDSVAPDDVSPEQVDSFYSETADADDDHSGTAENSYEPEASYESETSYESKNSYEAEDTSSESHANDDTSTENTDAEDDSIEAYMNRLLKRVHTEEGEEDTTTEAKTADLGSETVSKDTVSDSQQFDLAEEEDYDPNAPLVPRSQAPERNSNMDAMRALANQSARSAVARSVKLQARDIQRDARNKFMQVGVALLCAALCYVFLNWGMVIKGLAIGSILVISFILFQEAMGLTKEAKQRMQMASSDSARDDAEEATAQINQAESVASDSDADVSAGTLGETPKD